MFVFELYSYLFKNEHIFMPKFCRGRIKFMDMKSLWNFIYEFDQSYDYHRKLVMHRYDLTAMEVDVLLFLANNPEFNTSADFSRLRKIAKSHVSLAVNTLYEKGYVDKIADKKNKKKIHLVPTKSAKTIIDFGRAEQAKFTDVVDRNISEEERSFLRDIMNKMYQDLKDEYSDK